MSIYGITYYGTDYYGACVNGALGTPFSALTNLNAFSTDYNTIQLQWNQPNQNILQFRLIRSRFGFPVDENDGTILVDSGYNGPWPGGSYADNQIIQGAYHYYAIYILVDVAGVTIWYRSALAAVLAPSNFGNTQWMLNNIPEFYKNVLDIESYDLTTVNASGNTYLNDFISLFGWAADYMDTQLLIAQNVNNPSVIPVNYLYNLAATLGLPFYPEISAGTTRNFIGNGSTLIQQRGTLEGVDAWVTQIVGWPLDLQVGYNLFLEDDQSLPLNPQWANLTAGNPTGQWSTNFSYDVGEFVEYGQYVYSSGGVTTTTITHVNGSNIGNSSSSNTVTVTIPGSTGIQAGDVIFVVAASNGTHVTNGMTVSDNVNNVNYTQIEESQDPTLATYIQTFIYQTPQNIADGSHIILEGYAGSTSSVIAVDVFRNATVSIDQGVQVDQNASESTAGPAPALAANAAAGSLVLTVIGVDLGTTFTAGTPFVTGSQIDGGNDTELAVGIGYILNASGTNTYGSTWTLGAAHYSVTQTVSYQSAQRSTGGANLNNVPSGTYQSNSFWTAWYYQPDDVTLLNPRTGYINTWEPRFLNETNDAPQATATTSQTFNTGTGATFDVPAGVTFITVQCWGGGGGGCMEDSAGDGGAGGGGAEFAQESNLVVTPGEECTYSVGSAGTAGSSAGAAGTAGGVTTFATSSKTITAHGGGGAGGYNSPGSGGTGSTNSTHHTGGKGGTGLSVSQGSQTYSTSGNHTWTAPSGVSAVNVTTIAGGGGGGTPYIGSNYSASGGGGGGSAYTANVAVTATDNYTATVGGGGAGGGAGQSSGSSGGTSSFSGDSQTVSASGGGGGTYVANTVGSAGSGTSGSHTYSGGQGGENTNGTQSNPPVNGAGGGGAGGQTGAGGNGGEGTQSSQGSGGSGGSGPSGATGGAGGLGGSEGGTGSAGTGPGGGGGGGGNTSGSYGEGGAGAAGAVILTWGTTGGAQAGGGGSSAGTAAAGNAGTNASTGSNGAGGSAPTGGGAGGAGGSTTGTAGSSPGGAGGGGISSHGGAGAAGQIVVTYQSTGSANQALVELEGIQNRVNTQLYQRNGLCITNLSGSVTTMDLRSVSRDFNDINVGNAEPDPTQVIGDGIPIPFSANTWVSTEQYPTDAIVYYNGQSFVALKSSLGITPPNNNTASNEWQPLGYDQRIALFISAYTSQNTALQLTAGNHQVPVTPYIAFYDENGNHIVTNYARCYGTQYADVLAIDSTSPHGLAFAHTSGTVLTASANGVTFVDGVQVTTIGQTFLLTKQDSSSGTSSGTFDNGYYSVTTVGTSSVKTVLTRTAPPAPTAAEYPGSYVMAGPEGTNNSGNTYYCTNTSTPSLGTTAITYSQTPLAYQFTPLQITFAAFANSSNWGSAVTTSQKLDIGYSAGFSQYQWSAEAGTFNENAFSGGCIAPATVNTRTELICHYGIDTCMVGCTLLTLPNPGWYAGLVLLWSAETSYVRVDQNYIVLVSGTTYTIKATHSQQFQAGDRMTASCTNGGTIVVYRNGTQVSTYTSGLTGTFFGMIVEQQPGAPAGVIQPKPTLGYPRRDKRTSGRAWITNMSGPWGDTTKVVSNNRPIGKGVIQPRPTALRRDRDRRTYGRAVTAVHILSQTIRPGGTEQPQDTLTKFRRRQPNQQWGSSTGGRP